LKAGFYPAFLFLYQSGTLIYYFVFMRIHCIRHEPFEGLGEILTWIQLHNHQLSYTHIYLNEYFPPVDGFDLLIIMGGTASVYEQDKFPWLIKEKQFIQKAIEQGKKILGICLGAQLLADALDGRVYRGIYKEIGWLPVVFNLKGLPQLDYFPPVMEVFHWHGDTFDIPHGATLIGSTIGIENQGFVFGNNIIALQFHCEMNLEQLQMIINAAGAELLNEGKYIQTEKQIFEKVNLLQANTRLMFDILDHLARN
jgi:GMP synthase-like glutamine amidotransferase